jgi:hypothetical protein
MLGCHQFEILYDRLVARLIDRLVNFAQVEHRQLHANVFFGVLMPRILLAALQNSQILNFLLGLVQL